MGRVVMGLAALYKAAALPFNVSHHPNAGPFDVHHATARPRAHISKVAYDFPYHVDRGIDFLADVSALHFFCSSRVER